MYAENFDVAAVVNQALGEAMRERGRMNVLIAGRTGVGKSTLINAIFQGHMAGTGQGRPVTQNTREITKEGIPLSIWDTRGLEMAAFKDSLSELERLLADRAADRDHTRHIHVAWLCVQEDGRRVEDAEIELATMLSRHMPVIAVITKARADQGFRDEVTRLLPQTRSVVRVRALQEQLDDGHSLAPQGLTQLIEATSEVIPEGRRRALAAAQKASIEYKKSNARKVVVAATAAAVAAGASPIPFSDAIILVPVQIGMLAGITATFGLELSTGFLTTLLVSAAGGTGATLAGRAIAANLIKALPGAGSVVGGAISATTAGALTVALGEAYIAALGAAFVSTAGEAPSPESVLSEFRKHFKARLSRGETSESEPTAPR